MANVTEQLEQVQYYTGLDPYYYVVDNRPLRNLDTNIRLVAAASDASKGSADRASLAAASAAYGQLGYGQLVAGDPLRQAKGMFAADYTTSGFQINISHGYLLHPVAIGAGSPYVEPRLAIHDSVTPIICQAGRGGTLQVTFRDSTISDRIGSAESRIQVAVVTFKQGTGPGVYPSPDPGNVAIMHVNIPSDATGIDESHITLINMKTIKQLSDIQYSYKVVYDSYLRTVNAGLQTVSLAGSTIDTSRMDSVEVFVQGVNQFNWTYNSNTNSITLGSPVSQSAEVRVRQVNLVLV